ncbi:hypothetical protein ACTHGU_06245 [Chitinophagaceae bacterium MMS25-I14]
MELYITEDDLLKNIQHGFRQYYPRLKLEFYKHPHEKNAGSPADARLSLEVPVEDVVMFHTAACINVAPQRTVASVEEDFFHKLGLCVQIFRQSGDLWIETTRTDGYTLARQEQIAVNESGRIHETEAIEDFDLQDHE